MQITIDASDYRKLARQASQAERATARAARQAVKSASFAVEKRVKIEMPVDTGRARASWGHWTPSDIGKPGNEASAADATWRSEDGGLTITQGSNVGYIEQLNQGHSRQAPAGFLDTAQLTGQVELEKELGLIDPLDPNLRWLEL